MTHRYQPFYCEENVWWLCQAPELCARTSWALFVSSAKRACALWQQRAASPERPIVWDYHVLAIAEAPAEAWDLDTRLGMPVPLLRYLDETFRPAPARLGELVPRFRLVARDELVARLHTDRSHMRTRAGGWTAPPPPWDPPRAGSEPNLMRFVDVVQPFVGELLSLAELYARFTER